MHFCCQYLNELEDAVIMRIQALFIKENRLEIW